MKQHLHITREPNLQIIVITSVALHLLFITLIANPFKTKDREYKSYFVNLVAPVEMQTTSRTPTAKKTVKQKSKAAPAKVKPALRKRVKRKKGVSLEPEKTVSREIERLRAISAISKQKQQKERSAETEETISEAIENIRKGKEVVVSGMPGTTSDTKYNAYNALIQRKIYNEWIHPGFNTYLEAAISFNIKKSGKVTRLKVEKSSGNKQFDKSAIKAIKKASPLPPPPVEQVIELKFHYEK